MKLLFITAYFPPCNYGWGYMRICEQVADSLYQRGHDISVLTSTYRHGDDPDHLYPVHRLLSLDPDWHSEQSAAWQFFVGRKRREQNDIATFRLLLDEFVPDVIFVWHAHSLSRAMLQIAERLGQPPVVYYLANYLPELPDEYVEYWQAPPRQLLARWGKRPLAHIALMLLQQEGKPIRLNYENSISVSHYVHQRLLSQELIGDKAVVIPNGVDLDVYQATARNSLRDDEPLKCLIAGRIAPEKGIHTVLQALCLLNQQRQLQHFHLTILGDGPEDYKAQLEATVVDCGLEPYVTFAPSVPTLAMPAILAKFDSLILPSEWDEPLACIMLEAMSSNMLVIGTLTGGSGEALVHLKTGLVFESGQPQSLANQILTVIQDRSLVRQLARAGHQEMVDNFDISKTIKEIEQHLLHIVETDIDLPGSEAVGLTAVHD